MGNLFSEGLISVGKRKRHNQVVYKPYKLEEDYLFPQSTADYLPQKHFARALSLIIDKIDISDIENKYKGGGASAYNPRMLLKIWLLGFFYKKYSCRSLAQALHEHVAFIWISGRETPDFRTLNNFRLKLQGDMKKIFRHTIRIALKAKIINGEDIFIDHTKLEASANRFKIIWRKTVLKQMDKIDQELDALFSYVARIEKQEGKIYGKNDYSDADRKEFSPAEINQIIDEVNKALKAGEIDRDEARKRRKMFRRILELFFRLTTYKLKLAVLGKRNSYSKTDPDATAMRQKDQTLKPGYNEGIATQNGLVINYEISQSAGDTNGFIDIVQGAIENLGGQIPNSATADGAYGNEENYEYLQENGIKGNVKYPGHYTENKHKGEVFKQSDFVYSKEENTFTCPDGIKLELSEAKEVESKTGYKSKVFVYVAPPEKCGSCTMKPWCTTGQSRTLSVNFNYKRLKQKAKEMFTGPEGQELYSRRSNEVESVFGDRKYNQNKKRFNLRGLPKVDVESGLYYTVHNIRKIYLWAMVEVKKRKNPPLLTVFTG